MVVWGNIIGGGSARRLVLNQAHESTLGNGDSQVGLDSSEWATVDSLAFWSGGSPVRVLSLRQDRFV